MEYILVGLESERLSRSTTYGYEAYCFGLTIFFFNFENFG